MNAVHHITPLGRFKWLLKREYWENRGGFLRAPLVAGGISLLLSLMAIVAGLIAARRAAEKGDLHINGIQVNGLDLGMLTQHMTPADMAKFGEGMNMTLLLSSAWPFITLAFVVFFYCLGALYDDRRDRSVLFWKSMPISDTQTVLSKLVGALVIAPLLAVVAAIITMFGFMIMISLVVLFHGGNPVTLIWASSNPFSIAASHLAWIPVYALWAMPTALLVLLPLAARAWPQPALLLADAFYRAGALVFGGGHVVLPLLQAEVVATGWVAADEFLAGYGLAQAVPGPLFSFAAFLGAAARNGAGGWPGALVCLAAIFLPAFLLVAGALPFWERLRHDVRARAAMSGVNAAVVGLLLAALYRPVWTSAIHAPADLALALAALAALAWGRVPPWLVVPLCGAAGPWLLR